MSENDYPVFEHDHAWRVQARVFGRQVDHIVPTFARAMVLRGLPGFKVTCLPGEGVRQRHTWDYVKACDAARDPQTGAFIRPIAMARPAHMGAL